MKKSHILNIFLAILLTSPLPSLAQGADTVKITGMNAPFNFGRVNPARPYDIRINKNLCVYSSTGSYQVTITDTNNPARFEVVTPNAKPIDYQVFWNAAPNSSGSFELQSGQTSRVLSGASGECPNSGENANLEVVLRGAAIKGAKAGHYKPQISITVVPVAGP